MYIISSQGGHRTWWIVAARKTSSWIHVCRCHRTENTSFFPAGAKQEILLHTFFIQEFPLGLDATCRTLQFPSERSRRDNPPRWPPLQTMLLRSRELVQLKWTCARWRLVWSMKSSRPSSALFAFPSASSTASSVRIHDTTAALGPLSRDTGFKSSFLLF